MHFSYNTIKQIIKKKKKKPLYVYDVYVYDCNLNDCKIVIFIAVV